MFKRMNSRMMKSLLVKPVSIKCIASVFGLIIGLSQHSVVHAKEFDVNALVPIIALILEDDTQAVECPSGGFEAELDDNGDLVITPIFNERVGNVIITSQQALEEFAGVTKIDGDLTIITPVQISNEIFEQIDLTPVVDLSPLDSLLEVTGSLFVRTDIANIDGVNCLTSVGGDLNIQGNDSLEGIDGFKSLSSIGESLILIVNDALESVDGFRALEMVGINIQISGNDSLQSVAGLQSLETVGNSLSISNSPALHNLNGFRTLSSVGRDLQILSNTELTRLSGFQSLKSIGNDLSLFENDGLRSITGFQLLESIGFNLSVGNNSNLEGLGSLAALERGGVLGNISIFSNDVFDCGLPVPNFSVATFSSGNAINCPQDLASQTISSSNNESVSILDLGSVSSSITIPAQSGITGVVRSLEVSLDIEHTSVGNLTVTLSNGTTTINLLDGPSLLSANTIGTGITNECIEGSFSAIPVSEIEFSPTGLGEFIRGASEIDEGCTAAGLLLASSPNFGNIFSETDFLVEGPSNFIDSNDIFDSFFSFNPDFVNNVIEALEPLAPVEPANSLVCDSNNISLSLVDDISLLSINTSCISGDTNEAFPFGIYSPLQSLSAFEGSSVNETWTLTITDSESGNVGVLNGWGIVFDIDRGL